jgi:hypothetical protein
MVVNQEVYTQLSEQKRVSNKAEGLETVDNNYFPAYRCPTKMIRSQSLTWIQEDLQ